MAKLSVYKGGKAVGEIDFDEGLTLGRNTDNDLHLDDPAISQHHARIEAQDGHFRLEDLDSTNGTRVNRRQVGKIGLHDGDEISAGPYLLRYSGPDAPPSFQDTMILQLEDLAQGEDRKMDQALETTERADAESLPARIEVLSGDSAGEILRLEEEQTPVGVPGTQVAVVARRRDGYYLVPVGGGLPLINGEETPPRATRLQDRDRLEIAGVKLSFREA